MGAPGWFPDASIVGAQVVPCEESVFAPMYDVLEFQTEPGGFGAIRAECWTGGGGQALRRDADDLVAALVDLTGGREIEIFKRCGPNVWEGGLDQTRVTALVICYGDVEFEDGDVDMVVGFRSAITGTPEQIADLREQSADDVDLTAFTADWILIVGVSAGP